MSTSHDRRAGAVVEGYADRLSHRAGQAVSFACRTRSARFSAEIARVGADREIVWKKSDIPGRWQVAPDDASTRGCRWQESFRYTIPPQQRSGYYEVVLRAVDEGDGSLAEDLCFFVVRPDRPSQADRTVLLVLTTNTYNAYNDWGGPSLYTGATQVSFQRPMIRGLLRKPEPHVRYPNLEDADDPENEHFQSWARMHGLGSLSGSAGFHNWERSFVRWAEREGYAVDVAVNSDLEFHPEVLENQRLVVSVGHDEYWSWGMRDALESFVSRGGNVAFLSGNSVCWQVRYEDAGATMVSYRYSHRDDPLYGTPDQSRLTTWWSSSLIGRPENVLTGVSFSRGGYVRIGRCVPHASGGYTIWRPDHWVFAGTGLRYGDVLGATDAIVSYEVDGCELQLSLEDGLPVPTCRDGTPREFSVLATAPAQLFTRDTNPSRFRSDLPGTLESIAEAVFGDASPEHTARLSHNHAVMGIYTRGGTVFTAGTTEWAYGLSGRDSEVEKITRNVLDRLSRSTTS